MIVETLSMDEVMKSKTLREAFEHGCAEGVEQTLRSLFERRVGRPLTPAEQQAVATQARTGEGQAALDVALRLEGEVLAAWLLQPGRE